MPERMSMFSSGMSEAMMALSVQRSALIKQGMSSGNFMLGVVNLAVSAYILGIAPEHFWVFFCRAKPLYAGAATKESTPHSPKALKSVFGLTLALTIHKLPSHAHTARIFDSSFSSTPPIVPFANIPIYTVHSVDPSHKLPPWVTTFVQRRHNATAPSVATSTSPLTVVLPPVDSREAAVAMKVPICEVALVRAETTSFVPKTKRAGVLYI